MSEEPAERLIPDDGRAEEEPWQPPPHRSIIRLMGEHTVTVPLWSDEDGLMFSEPSELIEKFGVSANLAAGLEAWAIAWEKRAGQPDHDAEAAHLVRRLNQELNNYYRFVYRP